VDNNQLLSRDARAALKLINEGLVLDATDVQILRILQEDARLSYTGIGKRLRKAHSTIYDRIRRMEEQGIIRKYTAIIDCEKIGAKKITALVTVYTDPKETDDIAAQLAKKAEVLDVYTSLSEELLIIAKIAADDQDGLHSFIADCVAPLRGVLRIRTSIVTRKFKEADSHSLGSLDSVKVYKKTP